MSAEKNFRFLVNLNESEVCVLPADVRVLTYYDWYPVVISGQNVEEVIAENFRNMPVVDFNEISENCFVFKGNDTFPGTVFQR